MLSYPADMAELADAPDLGSGVGRRAGSSPVIRIFYKAWKHEPWGFRFVMCRRKTGFLVAVWARGIWSFFRLLVAKAHK